MQHLMIENDGVLELTGLRLMGASSKRHDDAKVGRFGSGWKYAAACILREAGDFCVTLGDVVVRVTTATAILRGQEHREVVFQVLDHEGKVAQVVDGGFTTGLGPDWKPWMALRELVSNAMDEGGFKVDVCEPALTEVDPFKTRAYVPLSPPFADAWAQREKLFRLTEGPVAEVPGGRILEKQVENVVRFYKRGIFIGEQAFDAKFDYDFDDIQLGEDRLPRGDIRQAAWRLLDRAPIEVKKAVLCHSFEASCYPYHLEPNPDWKEAFGGLAVVTKDEGQEGIIVVAPPFEHLATSVGARTKANDLAIKAGDRETMPADGRVRRACAKLQKLGVTVHPEVVLLAKLDREFINEGGLIYLSKALDEDQIFCALAAIGTTKGWQGSTDHLMALASLLLKGK